MTLSDLSLSLFVMHRRSHRGAAGALAPPLSDMGGQEYVCAPPLNVEQNHSYVEIILNHYNSSHFMANLFYFQQQLSKHFS